MVEARTDWAGLIDLVNARYSCGLTLDRLASGGDSGGVALVRWPSGEQSVLSLAPSSVEHLELIGSVLDEVRDRSIPVPRYQLLVQTDHGTAVVQEHVAGCLPTRLDVATVGAILDLTEGFAHVLARRPDVPPVNLHLSHGGGELFRHETLAYYDHRTRRLLDQIREIADETDLVAGDDLVHCDLTPGNVLVGQDGRITGAIDWHGPNGLARGDRNFGLVVFRFDVAWGVLVDPAYPRIDPEALACLDSHLDALPAHRLRRYWASMALRMADWTIRHHQARDVDHQLAFAASRLD